MYPSKLYSETFNTIPQLKSFQLRQRHYRCVAVSFVPNVLRTIENIECFLKGTSIRILSGFYGILRAFDGVVPYRLEMCAPLNVGKAKNLYEFWGDDIASNLQHETDFILNLASKEYSKSILPYLKSKTRFINCIFGEIINNRVIEKGTLCKMARGEMVRFLAENNILSVEEIKGFNRLGYSFSKELSQNNNLVFIK